MESTGWQSWGAVAADSSSAQDWISLGSALGPGGGNAYVDLPEEEYTEWMVFSDPQVSIPGNATNIQVYVRVTRSYEGGSGRTIEEAGSRLRLSGVPIGIDLSTNAEWGIQTYGPGWTVSLSPSDIPNLQFAMRAYSDSTREAEVYVDYAEIEITYDVPSRSAVEQIQYS
jgi:hypothetical protein